MDFLANIKPLAKKLTFYSMNYLYYNQEILNI